MWDHTEALMDPLPLHGTLSLSPMEQHREFR